MVVGQQSEEKTTQQTSLLDVLLLTWTAGGLSVRKSSRGRCFQVSIRDPILYLCLGKDKHNKLLLKKHKKGPKALYKQDREEPLCLNMPLSWCVSISPWLFLPWAKIKCWQSYKSIMHLTSAHSDFPLQLVFYAHFESSGRSAQYQWKIFHNT